MSKGLSFFATEKGKKIVFTGFCSVGGGLIFLNILPHTFFLNKYKEFVQLYKFGVEVPIDATSLQLFSRVLDDLYTPEQERKLINPFTVFGFDVFRAGTTTSKFGAIVGVPSNFAYKTTQDVDRKNIIVRNKPVDWSSEPGRDLQNALVLSEDAKKFAIGREIVSANTVQPYLNGIFPVGMLLIVYSFTHSLNRRLQLFSRPVAMRGLFYTITGLFGLGTWAFLKDYSTVYYETLADKEMCFLGRDYIQGGIEFYTKILQRNVAMRSLMGKEGEKLYSVSGNEIFFIRQKRLPVGYRKLYLENRLQQLSEA